MRALIISTTLLFAACECAQVPEELCLVGECDGGTSTGGGGGTGGGTGGGGAGGSGGGTELGGGAGGGTALPDAGVSFFCETWACVEALLPARRTTRPTFTVATVELPEADMLCTPRFSGGVLMPDDSVLLVPACARHFVRVDVETGATSIVGPDISPVNENLEDGGAGPYVPSFAGGALDCSGNVVAFPLGHYTLTRLTADGTFENLGAVTRSSGGVLRGTCVDAGVVMPSGNSAIATYTFGNSETYATATVPTLFARGKQRGCYRKRFAEPECLYAGVTLLGNYTIVRSYPLEAGPNGYTDFGAFARDVEGAALTRSGGVVLFNASTGESLTREVSGSVRRVPSVAVDAGAVSWPASRADGYIYAMGKHGLWVLDEDGDAGAELQSITGYESLSAPFMGLVGHPSGALVVVPAEADKILILRPDVPHPVPGRVLRSPFFNKL